MIDVLGLQMFFFIPRLETLEQLLYTLLNPIIPMLHDRKIFFQEEVVMNDAYNLLFILQFIQPSVVVIIINIFYVSHEGLLNHLN